MQRIVTAIGGATLIADALEILSVNLPLVLMLGGPAA